MNKIKKHRKLFVDFFFRCRYLIQLVKKMRRNAANDAKKITDMKVNAIQAE
jgi:hypothetical protein